MGSRGRCEEGFEGAEWVRWTRHSRNELYSETLCTPVVQLNACDYPSCRNVVRQSAPISYSCPLDYARPKPAKEQTAASRLYGEVAHNDLLACVLHRLQKGHQTVSSHALHTVQVKIQRPNAALDRQENLDAKVLPVLHKLAVEHDLIRPNAVALGVRGIGRFTDLDFTPLSAGGDLRVSAQSL